MVPLKTFELRAGHRVEMLTGMATVQTVTPDVGGGYAVAIRYDDGVEYTVRNAATDNLWTVEL